MSDYKDINVMIKEGNVVVNVNELADCLQIESQSGRDMLRHGISPDTIVKIPISKSQHAYYLTVQGVEEFVKKYKPEQYDEIMAWLSDIKNKTEDKATFQNADAYVIDLLEDTLVAIRKIEYRQQHMENLFLDVMSKVLITSIELEAMVSSGFSILMKAEAEGYLARTNRKRAHDLQVLSKEFGCNTDHYQKLWNELATILWGDEEEHNTKEKEVERFKVTIDEILRAKEVEKP